MLKKFFKSATLFLLTTVHKNADIDDLKVKTLSSVLGKKRGKKAPQLQQGKAGVRWKKAFELTFAIKAGIEVKSCSLCSTQVCGKLAKANPKPRFTSRSLAQVHFGLKILAGEKQRGRREPYPCYVTCAGPGLCPRVPPGARCWVTGTTARRGLPETE